jgi:hypothetical protein
LENYEYMLEVFSDFIDEKNPYFFDQTYD